MNKWLYECTDCGPDVACPQHRGGTFSTVGYAPNPYPEPVAIDSPPIVYETKHTPCVICGKPARTMLPDGVGLRLERRRICQGCLAEALRIGIGEIEARAEG